MKKLFLIINFFSLVLLGSNQDRPNRIGSIRFNKANVEKINLVPGLGSVLLLPCAIEEVFVGRQEDLKVQISPNDKKTLFLNLKLNSSLPTNLIIKCAVNKSVFVFDILPSKHHHQDLIEVRSSYGAPHRKDLVLMSKTQSTNRIVLKNPELVSKGVNQ